MEKSRDAVSVANIRTAYAQAQTAYLVGDNGGDSTVNVAKDTNGNISSISVSGIAIKSHQSNNWSGVATDLPFPTGVTIADKGAETDNATITFTYDTSKEDGTITGVSY